MIEIKFTGQTHEELTQQLQAYLASITATAVKAPEPNVAHMVPPATVSAPQPPAPVLTSPPQIPPVQAPAAVPTAIPTTTPTYTREDLMTAGAQLMQKVGMPALQQLLGGFGVRAIHELPEAQFGAFAQALRGIGGAI